MATPRRTYLALLALAACTGTVKPSGPPLGLLPPFHSVVDCPSDLSISIFRTTGFGIEWSYATSTLVYNKPTDDGYENLFTMDPDGQNERSLTFKNPRLPGKHVCSPMWTPAGDYLVFSAEKHDHGRSSRDAACGFGAYNDIWAMTADGLRAWQLTNVANDYDHGAMIPRLSRDGTKLLWTERIAGPNLLRTAQAFGYWVLAVADFKIGPDGPAVSNVRHLQPGPLGFYEGADWSPDGQKVLFTSSLATDNAWKSQLFRVDLATGALEQLTNDTYNEHPRYTPDGQTILWMSRTGARLSGTDWWLMAADGSSKRRLTYFEEPGHTQSSGSSVWPGSVAWDPTGRWFYGDIETNLVSQSYLIVRVACP
jgi:Tol biopolymer transport system component